MAVWGAFTNSSSAMMAQSHSLGTISQNIANVNTNGYKRTDTQFQTLLSETTPNFDFFGVQTADRNLIDKQGIAQSTGRWTDLAIAGNGFFIVNTKVDGSGETLFTRDGSFSQQALDGNGDGVPESYLCTGQGYYLMGWEASATGSITANGQLSALKPIKIDPLTIEPGNPTSLIEFGGNLNRDATTPQRMGLPLYDDTASSATMEAIFTKTGVNQWDMAVSVNGGLPGAAVPVTFNADGSVASPTAAFSMPVPWGTVMLDIGTITQTAGVTQRGDVEQDGYAEGQLLSQSFDSKGQLFGTFDNGNVRMLSQVPVATFVAPNQLELRNGTLFAATELAGEMSIDAAKGPGGRSSFVAGAVEASNVDMADEFTRMITTQKAYSSAATVFRTADEMMQTAGDLKR